MTQLTANVNTKILKTVNIDFDNGKMTICGITSMVESDDKQIVANMGDRSIVITGEKLQIVSLDTAHNECSVTGAVESIKYSKGTKKRPLLKRIFK